MKNEYYSWYKEHHICPFCRVNKPVGNHVYCHECRAKYREYQEKRIDRNRDEIYQKNRERYYRYKEQGLCVSCGKPAVPGKVFCQKCANKKNRKKRLKKLENATDPRWLWVEEHRCYLCGKPAIEVHKLCQKHYDESCKWLEKARAVAKETKIGLHAPFTFGGDKA